MSLPQTSLPFKYEAEKTNSGLTALAGLPLYMDFMHALGLFDIMRNTLDTEYQKSVWKASKICTSLILLNLSGGDSVDDLKNLGADSGFMRVFSKSMKWLYGASEHKMLKEANNIKPVSSLPSASTIFRFLNTDKDFGIEDRGQGKSFIPPENKNVSSLAAVNTNLISNYIKANSSEFDKLNSITLDMDATLIETHKKDALYSYKGYKAYQPLNIWFDELGVMLYTQFRDGNVPAGDDLLPAFKTAIEALPPTDGKEIFLRSDTAGYRIDLLKYCDDEGIKFAVGCPVTAALKQTIRDTPSSAWRRLDKVREYAEVVFVPNSLSTSKKHQYEFRFIVTRQLFNRQLSFSDKINVIEYPFPTDTINGTEYKIHAICTNIKMPADEIVRWYYKRSGHSEEVHAVLKNDLAGGKMPSGNFNANATWWWLAVISHNIHSLFKRSCLSKEYLRSRLKKLRYNIINIAARVVERGRELYIRLAKEHPANEMFRLIREAICRLRLCTIMNT
jgi:hypothetical protein